MDKFDWDVKTNDECLTEWRDISEQLEHPTVLIEVLFYVVLSVFWRKVN